MSYTAELTDGVTTYDFIYDAASQTNYSLRKGLRAVMEDTQVLQHIPDNGTSVPVWGNDRPRTIFLTKDVRGDTVDEVLNKIIDIKRMIDGADQQALRYWTDGDVNRVDFKIQRESATNHTLNPVRWGWVDDSGAHYNAAAVKNGFAIGILVVLHVSPYGEGAAITLRNDMASSPHFVEANTVSTLADGWNDQGTPTRSIASTIFLIGGQSQRVATDNSTLEGISSDTVAAGSGVDFVAYAWVYVQSGDQVTVQIRNGAATVLASKTVTTAGGANYDKSSAAQGTSAGSGVFYRLSFSSTTINTNGVQLYIVRALADATQATVFFVDGAYIELNQTVVPDAWCSTSAIENRYDPTSSNESRINYFDVWGIPGDSDALVKYKIDTVGTPVRQTLIAARYVDGKFNAADYPHWLESDELTYVTGWTNQTGTTDDHYKRFTNGGSDPDDVVTYTFTGPAARRFLSSGSRIFARLRSSSTTTTFTMSAYIGSVVDELNIHSSASYSVPSANSWFLADLGLVNASNFIPDDGPDYDSSQPTVTLRINVDDVPSLGTADIDFIHIFPVSRNFLVYTASTLIDNTNTPVWIDGVNRLVINDSGGIVEYPHGSMWELSPGNKMNRTYWSIVGSNGLHGITDDWAIELEIIPRTRHLLGTT